MEQVGKLPYRRQSIALSIVFRQRKLQYIDYENNDHSALCNRDWYVLQLTRRVDIVLWPTIISPVKITSAARWSRSAKPYIIGRNLVSVQRERLFDGGKQGQPRSCRNWNWQYIIAEKRQHIVLQWYAHVLAASVYLPVTYYVTVYDSRVWLFSRS